MNWEKCTTPMWDNDRRNWKWGTKNPVYCYLWQYSAILWICSVPKGPCVRGLVTSEWHYWEVMWSLVAGAKWMEIISLGLCSWSTLVPWPFSLSHWLPGCYKYHTLLPWYPISPQAESNRPPDCEPTPSKLWVKWQLKLIFPQAFLS